ncbi:hypothetical protein OG271_23820 [Micromonospora rifamycinica]|uniref:hypothetical protein n=1 Tax=Micromonospora rifamycinica TaxID=291594 RepID=UPI002E2DF6F5|nr:hypothetical protein [Micromonospora rifamycinica]
MSWRGGPSARGHRAAYLIGFATRHVGQPGHHCGGRFPFGLDLILDALDRAA